MLVGRFGRRSGFTAMASLLRGRHLAGVLFQAVGGAEVEETPAWLGRLGTPADLRSGRAGRARRTGRARDGRSAVRVARENTPALRAGRSGGPLVNQRGPVVLEVLHQAPAVPRVSARDPCRRVLGVGRRGRSSFGWKDGRAWCRRAGGSRRSVGLTFERVPCRPRDGRSTLVLKGGFNESVEKFCDRRRGWLIGRTCGETRRRYDGGLRCWSAGT